MSTSAFISTGQTTGSNLKISPQSQAQSATNMRSSSGQKSAVIKCPKTPVISEQKEEKPFTKKTRLITTPSATQLSFSNEDRLPVTKAPTYQLSPKADAQFRYNIVEKVARPVVEELLQDVDYSAAKCTDLCCNLSQQVLNKVKQLHIERYKFICTTQIGEKTGQSLSATSRCVWDDKTDNYTSVVYENKTLYAVVNIYGIYAV